jgi:hypothetical protein
MLKIDTEAGRMSLGLEDGNMKDRGIEKESKCFSCKNAVIQTSYLYERIDGEQDPEKETSLFCKVLGWYISTDLIDCSEHEINIKEK